MRIELTTSAWKAEVLPLNYTRLFLKMAVPTGIEPAISCVTGRHVNRYTTGPSKIMYKTVKWWRMTGSNRRPPACKAGALPAELILHRICKKKSMVTRTGFEPVLPP